MTDDIKVSHNEAESQFETTVEGMVAVAAYDMEGSDRIVFTHTNVPPELSGRGIANRLAQTALEHARAKNLTVVPQCAFIAKYIERNPQYKDLLQG